MPHFMPQDPNKVVVFTYFKDKPCGSIARADTLFTKPIGKTLQTNYTYVKMAHDIYVFDPQTPIIGQGGFGCVYGVYSLTSDKPYILKSQQITPGKEQEPEQESIVLHDLGLCQDSSKAILPARERQEHYIIMPYAGHSLFEHLTSSSRFKGFDLAIQVCWAVHCLHEGFLSKTRTSYAHRDIKPKNIAINSREKVQLIDLGAASTAIDSPPADGKKTTLYFPNLPSLIAEDGHPLTVRQLDVFALKRTLFMPEEVLCAKGKRDASQIPAILPQASLSRAGILAYFDTSKVRTDNEEALAAECFELSPLLLASLLVLAHYNLSEHVPLVLANNNLAYQILGLYFYYQPPNAYTLPEVIGKNLTLLLNGRAPTNNQQVPLALLERFVKAGFSYDLSSILTREHLFFLLPFVHEDVSPTIRQAAYLLWNNGVQDAELFVRLRNKQQLAEEVIECFYDEQISPNQRPLAARHLFAEFSRDRFLPRPPQLRQAPTEARPQTLNRLSSPYSLPRVAGTRSSFFLSSTPTTPERTLPQIYEAKAPVEQHRPRWK